jgi:mono/diheme cytochrome c family protein
MKLSLNSRTLGLLLAMVGLVGLLGGCTPNANAQIISPQLGAQLYALEASGEVEIAPTPEPLRIATMTPEEITAGLDADFAGALAAANPDNGQALALANGCVGCHTLDPNQQMAGPTWFHVGDTAANRQPGVSPALYLHDSIWDPNKYVTPGYPSGVMPQTFQDILSQEDLADLVAFLLAQHE